MSTFSFNGTYTRTGSYTVTVTDNQRLLLFDSASAVTATLPQPGTNAINENFALWIANAGAGNLTVSPTSATIDGAASLTLNQNQGVILFNDGTNYWTVRGIGGAGGSGTVTSVALTVPSRQTVTGSPVTSSGTLAIGDNAQSANEVFAGPASGSAAAPSFRALVSADLPLATTSAPGAVKPDGTTITISGGTISAAGGGTGWVPTPPSAPNSSGTAGQYSADSSGDYGYLCYATNQWSRFALSNSWGGIPITSGLQLWYDLNQESYTNGASIGTIHDWSGNGNHATGGSATFVTNAINGQSAASFPGNSGSEYALTTAVNLGSGMTIFAVFENLNDTTKQTFLSGARGSISFWANASGNTDCIGFDTTQTAQDGASSATLPAGGWAQANMYWTPYPTGSAYAFRIAEAAAGSGSSTESYSANQTVFGYNGATTSEFLDNEVAEFIVFNRVLSPSEITTMESWLNGKYGI